MPDVHFASPTMLEISPKALAQLNLLREELNFSHRALIDQALGRMLRDVLFPREDAPLLPATELLPSDQLPEPAAPATMASRRKTPVTGMQKTILRDKVAAAAIAHYRRVGRDNFDHRDVIRPFADGTAHNSTLSRWATEAVKMHEAQQPRPEAPTLDLPA